MSLYPATIVRDDNDTFLVRFVDVPFARSFGDSEADSLRHAGNALETAFIALIQDKQPIPAPSAPKRGQRTVALPALSAAKVALYEALRAGGVRKTTLAKRLGWHLPQIDRILDLRHASKLEQVEAALHALGKELVVDVRDAA